MNSNLAWMGLIYFCMPVRCRCEWGSTWRPCSGFTSNEWYSCRHEGGDGHGARQLWSPWSTPCSCPPAAHPPGVTRIFFVASSDGIHHQISLLNRKHIGVAPKPKWLVASKRTCYGVEGIWICQVDQGWQLWLSILHNIFVCGDSKCVGIQCGALPWRREGTVANAARSWDSEQAAKRIGSWEPCSNGGFPCTLTSFFVSGIVPSWNSSVPEHDAILIWTKEWTFCKSLTSYEPGKWRVWSCKGHCPGEGGRAGNNCIVLPRPGPASWWSSAFFHSWHQAIDLQFSVHKNPSVGGRLSHTL